MGTPLYCVIYSTESIDRGYIPPVLDLSCMVLFFATFCIGIGVLVTYATFPKKFCNRDDPEEPREACCIYTGPSCGYDCCREKIEIPEDSFPKIHSDYYNEDCLGSSNEERVRFSTISP